MPAESILSFHIRHNESSVRELSEEKNGRKEILQQYNEHLLAQQRILNGNIEEIIQLREDYKLLRMILKPPQKKVYRDKIKQFEKAITEGIAKIEQCGVFIMMLRDNLTNTAAELKEIETYLSNLKSVNSTVSSPISLPTPGFRS